MDESIVIALEIYLIAAVVAVLIAGLIKGMLAVITRISANVAKKDQNSEVEI
jgi:hypothetical protein